MSTAVFAPATLANLGAGFDVLGVALRPLTGEPWGDVVTVTPAERSSFVITGPWAHDLPTGHDNLCVRSRDLFQRAVGDLPPMRLQLHKGLPLASGLGSSSASVVATLVALNHQQGRPLTHAQLLELAGQAEASLAGAVHLDNVAPCLWGGVQLIVGGRPVALPWPEPWRLVLAQPRLQLTTRTSRAVLPHQLPMPLAVAHAAHLGGLVQALHTGDAELLSASLQDVVAEPHRAPLVPGFREAQAAARAHGALGCSLSGAGPAVFAVAEAAGAAAVADALVTGFAQAGVLAQAQVCVPDSQGARVVA